MNSGITEFPNTPICQMTLHLFGVQILEYWLKRWKVHIHCLTIYSFERKKI